MTRQIGLLLLGFFIGVWLKQPITVKAQDTLNRTATPEACAKMTEKLRALTDCPPSHAAHDLTVRDIVEILGEFDLIHREQQPFFTPAYGVTNFESTPPAIWIFSTGDMHNRKSTIFHEFLHCYYRSIGMDPPEEFIRQEEDRQFAKWFGVIQ